MWEKAKTLKMTNEQRTTLEAWRRAQTSPQRTVLRARICLLAADGLSNNAIAAQLSISRPTVIQWRKRFEQHGPLSLAEDASSEGNTNQRTVTSIDVTNPADPKVEHTLKFGGVEHIDHFEGISDMHGGC